MNTLIRKTFFEKVDRTGCAEGELGKVLHGQFEQHGETLETPDKRTLKEFIAQTKHKPWIHKEVSEGCFAHSYSSHLGIRSYHTVELIEG